jgi:PAS domain-containing protein
LIDSEDEMAFTPSAEMPKTNPIKHQTFFLGVSEQEASFLKDVSTLNSVESACASTKIGESLRLATKIFESSNEAVVITTSHHKFIDVNPAFSKITGYDKAEMLHQPAVILNSHHHDQNF